MNRLHKLKHTKIGKRNDRPSESLIVITIPLFEENDDYVCSNKGHRMLGMYEIPSDPARCVCVTA